MANPSQSSGASVTQPSPSISENILKRKSTDIGWEFGVLVDPLNLDKVKCNRCGKVISGGAYRMKEHIAHISGNVSACPRASPEDQARCRNAIMEAKNKKKNKKKNEEAMRAEVNIGGAEEENEIQQIEALGVSKRPRFLGPMDRFASVISPDSRGSGSKSIRQQNINEAMFKERTHQVQQYVARWVYETGVSFNALNKDSFSTLLEAVGQFGPGFKAPSQYQLREPLLKEEVERTKGLLKKHELEWAVGGCSIMTDAWTDRKRRSILNLCVNCREGTTFLESKDSSNEAHTAEHIFNYVDKCIEQVGPEKVVQVVTDNATNNMAAAKLLKRKRPNIFWTSCATHTINLMLESIGKLPRYQKIIEQAKAFTIFIYAHHKTLSMMRLFTKKRDVIRPGVTRFASSFLSLQSLMEKKANLKTMFSSDTWDKCKWSKTVKGKAAYSTVMSMGFWNGVTICLKVFAPLVKVLRLVDGDTKPAMGFLYGELKQAKKEIMEALNNVESNYRPVIDIINSRMTDRLDTPLHTTAYLLNPYYFFQDQTIADDQDVLAGVFGCVEVVYADDLIMQNQIINVELPQYKLKEGIFGKSLSVKGCEQNDEMYNPGNVYNFTLFTHFRLYVIH